MTVEDLALSICADTVIAATLDMAQYIVDARVTIELKSGVLPPYSCAVAVEHDDSPEFWGLVLYLPDDETVTVTRLYCWECGWRGWRKIYHCPACHIDVHPRRKTTIDVMEESLDFKRR